MLLSFAQGVRDLVISANSQTQAAVANANSQTQAALAAMNASLQSIGAEVYALKELYLRKPPLKKMKVGIICDIVYTSPHICLGGLCIHVGADLALIKLNMAKKCKKCGYMHVCTCS